MPGERTSFVGIIGDGVRFMYVLLDLMAASPFVASKHSQMFSFTELDKAKQFFAHCLRLLRDPPKSRFDWPWSGLLTRKDLRTTIGALSVKSIVAVALSSIVLRCDEGGERKVIKVARNDEGSARMRREVRVRAELAVDDVCEVDENFFGHYAIKFVDDGAVSIEDFVNDNDLNRGELSELASHALVDVGLLLDALHKKGYTFCDVHVGNILVKREAVGRYAFRLIDFECVVEIGTPVTDKRILHRRGFRPPLYDDTRSVTSIEGDLQSLLLVAGWILNVHSSRSYLMQSMTSVNSKPEAADNEEVLDDVGKSLVSRLQAKWPKPADVVGKKSARLAAKASPDPFVDAIIKKHYNNNNDDDDNNNNNNNNGDDDNNNNNHNNDDDKVQRLFAALLVASSSTSSSAPLSASFFSSFSSCSSSSSPSSTSSSSSSAAPAAPAPSAASTKK